MAATQAKDKQSVAVMHKWQTVRKKRGEKKERVAE